MDLRNVNSLVIPEGEVRMIEDSLGRQLWGKLSYETKYLGDSSQQTYSGKNLCSGCKLGNATKLLYFKLPHLTSGQIVVSATLSISLTGSIYGLEIDGVFTQLGTWGTGAGNKLKKALTLTSSQIDEINNSTEAWIRTYKSAGGFAIPDDAMIEYGTAATSYEPYVGGVASPNPSYPQTVNVVTGTQTITLSDGVISDDYTVGLGNIELCKIGNHQDYVYKSGDDWYVHKEIGKYTFDGSEQWVTDSYGTNSWRKDHMFNVANYAKSSIVLMTDIGQSVSYDDRTHYDNPLTCVCFYLDTNERFWVRNTALTTLAQVQTATTGKNVYYWATPTDIQITDSTLISQLEAVHQFLIRYGYNATVSGNLPVIIDKTNLS